MKAICFLAILLTPSLAFASSINASVIVGTCLTLGMASCVAIGYVVYQKQPEVVKNRFKFWRKNTGPVISFEVNFLLLFRGRDNKHFLPRLEKANQQWQPTEQVINFTDPNWESKIRQCFIDCPELLMQEKKAGRLFSNREVHNARLADKENPLDLSQVAPGMYVYEYGLKLKAHYQCKKTDSVESVKKHVSNNFKKLNQYFLRDIHSRKLTIHHPS